MFDKKLFRKILLTIIVINILSLFAFYSPTINWLSYFLILLIAALLAWRNLYYGLLIIVGELMISSQGHLFDLSLSGFRLSLRMGIFSTVLIVVGIKALAVYKRQHYKSDFKKLKLKLLTISKKYKYYILLAAFVIWGVINGLIRGNDLNFLYQDANGYLFFLLLPVFVLAFKQISSNFKMQISKLLTVWAAAICWQFIISILLLFLYGHLDIFWRGLVPIYAWFRDQRLIEVGLYEYNFYRIFMQSGIWALSGFFIFFSLWYNRQKKQSWFRGLNLILIFCITTLIISLSRSFWLAGAITFFFALIFFLFNQKIQNKNILKQGSQLLAMTVISLVIVAITLILPIGKVPGLKSLISIPERLTKTEEPALSSRWELLPALWHQIKPNLIFGNGFGATVTYKTEDPRYLEAHPDNPYYTTFAFEWGWLDIWYKLGLFGLLTYLLLIVSVLVRGLQMTKQPLVLGLTFGLIAVTIVHFFTPFLNHPLGIGYLLLTAAIIEFVRIKKNVLKSYGHEIIS